MATVDDQNGPAFTISLANGADTANMVLHRTVNDAPPGECPLPPQVITPTIDAGVVYGAEPEFLEKTLRAPGVNSHLVGYTMHALHALSTSIVCTRMVCVHIFYFVSTNLPLWHCCEL